VFTDKNGGVRVACVQRHGLRPGEPDWYDIALFDGNVLRVSAELRPGKPLDLAILDNIGTHYGLALDANELKLKQDGRAQFPELSGLYSEPRRPVALYNGSGIQIWKAPVVLGQPAAAPTILPSKIQVLDDTSMGPSERRSVAAPKGDMRPLYRVVGRLRNDSAVEIGAVHLRISILDGSMKEVDGADISLSMDLPPGATRAFDQEIQVLPPPKYRWTCEVISATPNAYPRSVPMWNTYSRLHVRLGLTAPKFSLKRFPGYIIAAQSQVTVAVDRLPMPHHGQGQR
jgi:hypothetical protein